MLQLLKDLSLIKRNDKIYGKGMWPYCWYSKRFINKAIPEEQFKSGWRNARFLEGIATHVACVEARQSLLPVQFIQRVTEFLFLRR